MVAQVTHQALQVTGNVVEDTDVFYAVIKGIVFPILDTLSSLYENTVTPGLDAFYGTVNSGLGFIGAVRLVFDLNKWVNKGRQDWKETAQLICNTVGKFISTFKYLEKMDLISLGTVSKAMFANIPVLTLASSVLRVGADGLAICVAKRDIQSLEQKNNVFIANLEAWESVREFLHNNEQENINDKALNMLRVVNPHLGSEEKPVTVNNIREISKQILEEECCKADPDAKIPELDDQDVTRFLDLRVSKYQVACANNRIDRKLKWIGIAFSVSRIALTALITVGSALMIASLPAMVALTITFGLTTGIIGLSNMIMLKMKGFNPLESSPKAAFGGVTIR
ncbi:MAG: hypothetical protein WD595_02560 [Waddliaceae bacterium]